MEYLTSPAKACAQKNQNKVKELGSDRLEAVGGKDQKESHGSKLVRNVESFHKALGEIHVKPGKGMSPKFVTN